MHQRLPAFLLRISVPLCTTLAATGLQVFFPGIYAQETPVAAAGAVASDILDLFVVLPALVVTTILARRGSPRALLIWTGTLAFLCYNFAIYAFGVHFNAMFLVYCAVLALSFYGLIGVRRFLVDEDIAKTYGPGAPRRSIAAAFIAVAVIAAAGELQEIFVAMRDGRPPATAVAAGQLTNPVHVLDLCFLLPAAVIGAVLLLRRKSPGFTLAPVLLVVLLLISLEVMIIIVISTARGLTTSFVAAVLFAAVALLMAILLGWFLSPHKGTTSAVTSTGG